MQRKQEETSGNWRRKKKREGFILESVSAGIPICLERGDEDEGTTIEDNTNNIAYFSPLSDRPSISGQSRMKISAFSHASDRYGGLDRAEAILTIVFASRFGK